MDSTQMVKNFVVKLDIWILILPTL